MMRYDWGVETGGPRLTITPGSRETVDRVATYDCEAETRFDKTKCPVVDGRGNWHLIDYESRKEWERLEQIREETTFSIALIRRGAQRDYMWFSGNSGYTQEEVMRARAVEALGQYQVYPGSRVLPMPTGSECVYTAGSWPLATGRFGMPQAVAMGEGRHGIH